MCQLSVERDQKTVLWLLRHCRAPSHTPGLSSFLCGSAPMLELMLEQSFLARACLVFLFIAEKDRIS